ncbi:cysteine desulfurase-like protein [Amycolatopsis sp. NPDC059657]|uniref:cysteine desulfurase-like protein n=1 Tax=Amycolatopsis sp. NPDC059657 TaxID=3346899 RepID=UPI00366DD288
MAYDVTSVRKHFPALADGTAYFDGPGGTQTPSAVAAAIAETLTAGVSNRGRVTAAERRADAVVAEARQAVADLLGAVPDGVVFGRSMTQVTYDLSRALAKGWREGDEIVVSRLDHDANIRPWVQAAEARGVTVRWAEFDRETGELGELPLTDRTRLVAVTGASNLLGTRPDLPAIAAETHAAGALLYVDGVHLTPHSPVDIEQLGADFYACSPYKFLGPHLGLVAASPALLETVHPDKLEPSVNVVPERFELGTLPYELLAGTTAAIDFLAGLVPGTGTRRERLTTSMRALEEYESALLNRLETGLDDLGARRYGSPEHRTPTALFTLDGVKPKAVYEHLATRGVNAPAGTFYALEPARRLGLERGAVRAGIAPYTDESDVDRLLAGLLEIAK